MDVANHFVSGTTTSDIGIVVPSRTLTVHIDLERKGDADPVVLALWGTSDNDESPAIIHMKPGKAQLLPGYRVLHSSHTLEPLNHKRRYIWLFF